MLHQSFLRQQYAVQARFDGMLATCWSAPNFVGSDVHLTPVLSAVPYTEPAALTPKPIAVTVPALIGMAPVAVLPTSAAARTAAPHAAAVAASVTTPVTAPSEVVALIPRAPVPRTPVGPSFNRAALEIHAGGAISTIFGPLFAQQDRHERQVRMPEPPMLLADRVLGIEGEAGTMGVGTIWTETHVREGAFYLHEGRMPAGILVESGQADLMLISWLGADFHNQGERVYRLLGCELTSHGPLPTIGDTLHYEIMVDGHAEQQGVQLFFFHYDCWVNGELRLSVRSGQAGFFTDEELAKSAGVLWSADTATPKVDARMDAPVLCTTRRALTADMVTALCEGRLGDCYGPGFERADVHTRTPTIAGGRMRLLDDVTDFDPGGGPWGRGYLRARLGLTPDHWFFDGHFKNDPCMPGTLMLEGGLQAMQIFMTGLGFTLDHDGSRFEPVPEQNYSLRCRGQATPASREVVYEIFVEEIVAGNAPHGLRRCHGLGGRPKGVPLQANGSASGTRLAARSAGAPPWPSHTIRVRSPSSMAFGLITRRCLRALGGCRRPPSGPCTHASMALDEGPGCPDRRTTSCHAWLGSDWAGGWIAGGQPRGSRIRRPTRCVVLQAEQRRCNAIPGTPGGGVATLWLVSGVCRRGAASPKKISVFAISTASARSMGKSGPTSERCESRPRSSRFPGPMPSSS